MSNRDINKGRGGREGGCRDQTAAKIGYCFLPQPSKHYKKVYYTTVVHYVDWMCKLLCQYYYYWKGRTNMTDFSQSLPSTQRRTWTHRLWRRGQNIPTLRENRVGVGCRRKHRRKISQIIVILVQFSTKMFHRKYHPYSG